MTATPAPFTPVTLDLIRRRERAGVIAGFVAIELGWDMARLRRVCIAHGIKLAGIEINAIPSPSMVGDGPRVPGDRYGAAAREERHLKRAPYHNRAERHGTVRSVMMNIGMAFTPQDAEHIRAEMRARGKSRAGLVGDVIERLIDTNGFDTLLGPAGTGEMDTP